MSGTTNIYSSLNVQGVNILNSINNLSSIINSNSSAININESNTINFIIDNNTQLTKIDIIGLSVFHAARDTIFPYNYAGWYNVRFGQINVDRSCSIIWTILEHCRGCVPCLVSWCRSCVFVSVFWQFVCLFLAWMFWNAKLGTFYFP